MKQQRASIEDNDRPAWTGRKCDNLGLATLGLVALAASGCLNQMETAKSERDGAAAKSIHKQLKTNEASPAKQLQSANNTDRWPSVNDRADSTSWSGTPRQSVQTHDAGMVLQGELVRHTFVYKNRSGGRLRLLDRSADIETSCGCTSVTVSDSVLLADQQTDVTLTINTVGKAQVMQEQATIRWTDNHGQSWTGVFQVKTQLQVPITFQPPRLFFDRDDVQQGVIKTVRCQTLEAVDWRSVAFDPSRTYVKIVHRQPGGDGVLTLGIRCEATDAGGTRQATIRAQIPADAATGRPASTAVLPISSHDTESLRCVPPILIFQREEAATPDDGQRSYHATVMISGDALEKEVAIEQVSCPLLDIEYHAQRVASTAIRVQLVARHRRQRMSQRDLQGDTRLPTDANTTLGYARHGVIQILMDDGNRVSTPYRLLTRERKGV